MYKLTFFIVFLSSLVCADLPVCHPDYDEWVSVDMPDSWCYSRQCKGDADGFSQGGPFLGYTWVLTADLNMMVGAYKIKEPPEGPGIAFGQISADFDHKEAGSPYVGYYRVGTTDACILSTYYGIKEPPKGPGVPDDCALCDTPGSGLQGPQLSLRVNKGNGFFDTDFLPAEPNSVLTFGITNTTADAVKYYDGYICVTAGLDQGDWTGSSWVYDTNYMFWTYFGTTPIADKDTWHVQTTAYATTQADPQGITSTVEYLYRGTENVTIELYNEFFELVDSLTIQATATSDLLPDCHPDYQKWLNVGAPASWSIPRQCKGDTDDFVQGSMLVGMSYVLSFDLAILLDAFKIKESPDGPGVSIDQLAADFDHKSGGSPYVGYYRVGSTDAAILASYYYIKEPPKGPGITPDCDECDTPGSGLQGAQLSLWVSQSGGAFQDTDVIEVDPSTVLQIGINNTTTDSGKCYDGYISITGGHVNGSWTGSSWVYDPSYFNWTYFGTSPVANKDTWYMETVDIPLDTANPSGISSSVEYLYNADGNVTIELYNEFFELVDTLTIQLNSSLYLVDVLSPNGNEVYQSGTSVNVTWDTVGQIDAVDIDYSLDGGSAWQSIVAQTANDGLYSWDPIPIADSNDCLIRVSDSFNPIYTDASDSAFTIFTCAIAPIAGDFNDDCYVNLEDLAVFCENWLLCGNQFDPLCGP